MAVARFEVTARGDLLLAQWGVQTERLHRRGRVLARPCLDWSERQDHLAGALGVAITAAFFAQRWIVRVRGGRAVRLTDEGTCALRRDLGLTLDDAAAYDARTSATG